MSNLEIWDKLGKTAPEHTKKFSRAGGFKGTAIKPIYTERKMTEVFGPAGQGWGMGEPSFQVVNGNDGQVAVYCTVALWHGARENIVYGVGGDMVVVKQSSGLRTDDEAFKKAFTDAVGNAMKHLGMSADVHMGLFDDSKYVQERAAEEAENRETPGNFATAEPKAKNREVFSAVMANLMAAGKKGRAALRDFWTSEDFIAAWEQMPTDWQSEITAEKDAFLASYDRPTGGKVDPNTSLDQQFNETMRGE